jgi:hypothetical protein
MSIAGIVIYTINPDGSLEGRWTHPTLQGQIGTERAERASDGTPGKMEGSYAVQVYNTDGQKLFEGSLSVHRLGEAYTLTWSGVQVLPQLTQATFTGIGVIHNGDTLVATFQAPEQPSSG